MLLTTSWLYFKNWIQWSVNYFRPCILEKLRAMWLLWTMIKLGAACVGENAYGNILTMSQNVHHRSVRGVSTEREWSANDSWSYILVNLTAMQCMKISRPLSTIEHSWSVNNFYRGSACYITMNCILLFIKRVLCGQSISLMYCSCWKPPGVSERMWSVNLDVSISGEYQTLGGHSGRPSK